MIVHKYGGSSVSILKIKNIAIYLKDIYNNIDDKIVVVVSAMGKTTNRLIEKANEITKDPSKRELDRLMSIGEIETISLLSIALNDIGIKAISYTAEQLKINTTGIHNKSRIKSIDTKKITEKLDEGYIVIVAGFQGVNEIGDITTLGRGGSDTSAVALAASLGCSCEIYTDVDGIYTIDPRIYTQAKKIKYISYEQMMELAYLGAGVMEPRAVELGSKYNVPIYVGLSLSSKNGTYILSKEKIVETNKITGISINEKILMVTIDRIPTYAKNLLPIFEMANKLGINIDMISHNDVISENGSIAFTSTIASEKSIKQLFDNVALDKDSKVLINKDVAKVSIVGIGMISHIDTTEKIFKVLAKNNMSFHQISTSQISISIIVDKINVNEIAKLLAKEFDL